MSGDCEGSAKIDVSRAVQYFSTIVGSRNICDVSTIPRLVPSSSERSSAWDSEIMYDKRRYIAEVTNRNPNSPPLRRNPWLSTEIISLQRTTDGTDLFAYTFGGKLNYAARLFRELLVRITTVKYP